MYSKAAAIRVAGFGIDFGLKTLDFLQVLSQFAFTQDQKWMLNSNRIAPPSSLDREFAAWCVGRMGGNLEMVETGNRRVNGASERGREGASEAYNIATNASKV